MFLILSRRGGSVRACPKKRGRAGCRRIPEFRAGCSPTGFCSSARRRFPRFCIQWFWAVCLLFECCEVREIAFHPQKPPNQDPSWLHGDPKLPSSSLGIAQLPQRYSSSKMKLYSSPLSSASSALSCFQFIQVAEEHDPGGLPDVI
jgi:hypothetical protein